MATAGWKGFTTPALPVPLSQAVSGLGSAAGTITTVAGALLSILKAGIALEKNLASPTQLLIQQVVKTLEDALKSFTQDTGAYVLFVPPRKKLVIPPLLQDALDTTGLSMPSEGIPAAILDTLTISDINDREYITSLYGQEGGLQGFARTIVESLYDVNDANRPDLEKNKYVAGLYIVGGATLYTDIVRFVGALGTFLGTGVYGASLDPVGSDVIPNPQGLRARIVSPSGTPAVQLEWDAPSRYVEIGTTGTVYAVDNIAILRSSKPNLFGKHNAAAVFGSKSLRSGQSVGAGDDKVQVISVLPVTSLSRPAALLDENDIKFGKTYYYTLCYDGRSGTSEQVRAGSGTALGYSALSSVVKVCCDRYTTRSSRGVPPDWQRTPRVIDLLPGMAGLADLLIAQVRQFATVGSTSVSTLQGAVDFIDRELERYTRMSTSIGDLTTRVKAIADDFGQAGAYVRAFAGEGRGFFIQDLSQSVTASDAPPFQTGDEYVAGAVILAAAPSPELLEPIKQTLGLIFGGAAFGTAKSAMLAAIDTIDVALRNEEKKYFDPSLQRTAVPQLATKKSIPQIGEDDADGIDRNCGPLPRKTIVIDDSFGAGD